MNDTNNPPQTFRDRVMACLVAGLRMYTRFSPFKRGRGLFVRPIEALKMCGWPAPVLSLRNGLRMEFEPSLVGWTCFEQGEWEPAQSAIVLENLLPDAIVLNIGANTGYYALLMASAVRGDGHVYAFEIQPKMSETMCRNIAYNDLQASITVVEMGCYSAEGEATIHCPGDPGSARLGFGSDGTRVPLTTVDQYVAGAALKRVDFILIDAEGADFEILKGASAVITRFQPIVMAETDHLPTFGGSTEQLIAFMGQFGYSHQIVESAFSIDILFVPTANRSDCHPVAITQTNA